MVLEVEGRLKLHSQPSKSENHQRKRYSLPPLLVLEEPVPSFSSLGLRAAQEISCRHPQETTAEEPLQCTRALAEPCLQTHAGALVQPTGRVELNVPQPPVVESNSGSWGEGGDPDNDINASR